MDRVVLWIVVFDPFLWYFVASCWLQTTASLFRESGTLYTLGAKGPLQEQSRQSMHYTG